MSHILITGGTGMLKDAALFFAKHSFTVSVIGRNQLRLDELINQKTETGFINPIKVDYKNYEMLEEKIISAVDSHGIIDTSIHWIHSKAPEAPYVIAGILNKQNIKSKFYHILGCEFANPHLKGAEVESSFERFENLIYRKIILGFVNENNSARWLTNYEISNGVIDAVSSERNLFIVGAVSPWSLRPEF